MLNNRNEVIDVLRGFALMGLFLVHMVEYFELYWYAPKPSWVSQLVFGLFMGKAYALFAFMFGVSFYVLLEAPSSKASLTYGRYLWRLLILWCLGYLHSLLYAGDILQILAIGGVLLLFFHHFSDRILIALSCIFLLQIPYFIQYALLLPDETYTQPKFWAASAANVKVFADADLATLLQYNAWQGQTPKWLMNFETGAVWNFLGLFLAGIIMARRQLFGARLSNRMLLIAIISFSLASFAFMIIRDQFSPNFPTVMPHWVFEEGFTRISRFCLVGVYLFSGILIYRFTWPQRLLKPLAACGRASLSLYVLQSLIFVPIYYGFGLSGYKYIGPYGALALGVAAWVLQVMLANGWLRRYPYAPLETLWRRATRWGVRNEEINRQ